MDNKLKPCPFCSRDGMSLVIKEGYDKFNEHETFYIYCRGCGIKQSREVRNKEWAIEQWNSRKIS